MIGLLTEAFHEVLFIDCCESAEIPVARVHQIRFLLARRPMHTELCHMVLQDPLDLL